MKKVKIVYWQDDAMWLGYLQDFPDYLTQGETFEELQENLRDIMRILSARRFLLQERSVNWLPHETRRTDQGNSSQPLYRWG
jgi:predicted RNase H-like HicB family nuclease